MIKVAVITDASAYLSDIADAKNLFILDIPVLIDGESYLEGKNLTAEEFYEKMAVSKELPKTSQPSLAELELLLQKLESEGYTHVIGLFLSSGISGFYQNIQFLKDEFPNLELAFPDTKITSAPLGFMVQTALEAAEAGDDFSVILEKVQRQIEGVQAYILVDDLNHLVKGGRLSNGAALLGSLLSIKPILYFTDEGKIEVYDKVRTEKKAMKRLCDLVSEQVQGADYYVAVIHSNCEEKALQLRTLLQEAGVLGELPLVTFGSVIGTHLGAGSVAVGFLPRV